MIKRLFTTPLISLEPWRLHRLRIRLYFLLAGAVAGYWVAILVEEGFYAIAFYVLVLAATLALIEVIFGDLWTQSRFPASTRTVLSRLDINYERVNQYVPAYVQELIQTLRGCDTSQVSGTVHLKVPVNTLGGGSEQALVQLTRYAGARGDGAWRVTHASKGIIGRCLRTERQETANFASREEYLERMVTEFGFFPGEARTHATTARSYLAHPIVSGGRLVGVLYLYSTEQQVFPTALDQVRVQGTSATIAAFLEGAVSLSELA